MLAAITATVPDQVPVGSAARSAAGSRSPRPSASSPASGIAAATGSIAAGYLADRGVLVVLAAAVLLRLPRHRAAAASVREPFDWRAFLRAFWISPRAHPDFAWAWITRFLMNLGNALLLLYLLYYLRTRSTSTDDEAEDGVFVLTAVYGVCTVVTAVVGGIWSRPARPAQGLRDLVRALSRPARAAARVRDDWPAAVVARGRSSASASASTPRSTSR